MRDYEEKSYYEIQLDNKQLILVFLAGVTVCVLVFILGVMVGKGQKEAEIAAVPRGGSAREKAATADDAVPPEVKTATEEDAAKEKGGRKTKKEKPVASQPPAATDEYAYTKLDKSDSETPLTPLPEKEKKTKPEEEASAPGKEESTAAPLPAAGTGSKFTVQVMATGSREKADQQLNYLKAKGYTAFMSEEKTGSGASVYKVRVGRFSDSESAKKIATRLKQDLKLETWVAVLE